MFNLENLEVKNILHIEKLELTAPVTCIVGESGSGKSTLLRLLNNLDDPASGVIYFDEKQITTYEPRELRKKVVMIPQTPIIFDGTIRDNLLIGIKFSGAPTESDEILNDVLEMLSLNYSLETDASDLSGGEQQRIAIGRILLMKSAEVFLLDEPSSALDSKTAEHVLSQFIEQAQKSEQKIIMVTHDQKVQEKFADEVISMDQYRVHAEGNANGR